MRSVRLGCGRQRGLVGAMVEGPRWWDAVCLFLVVSWPDLFGGFLGAGGGKADSPVFGVRIPPERWSDPFVQRVRRIYRRAVVLTGAVLGAGWFLLVIMTPAGGPRVALLTVGTEIVFLVAASLAYVWAHRGLKAARADRRWTGGLPLAGVPERRLPASREIRWAWFFPSALVLALMLFLGLLFDPGGRRALLPVLTGLLLNVPVLGAAAWLSLAPHRLHGVDRETTLLRQRGARRSALAVLAVAALGGNVSALLVGLIVWGRLPSAAWPVVFVPVILTLLGMLVAGVSAGGGRLELRLKAATARSRPAQSDDDHWWGGLFYANPDDPSIIVEKGVDGGWMLNFGHPVVTLLASEAALAVVVAAFLLPLALTA